MIIILNAQVFCSVRLLRQILHLDVLIDVTKNQQKVCKMKMNAHRPKKSKHSLGKTHTMMSG